MIPTHAQSPLAALTLAGALLMAVPAHAFTLEEFRFEDPARAQEFRTLIGTLRCVVCQNESLAASQANLAQDLRQEIYRLMQQGHGRQEILDFLVARYGDFVLYEPPLRPSTLVLWFGPFLFVGFGAYLLARTLQRKRAEPEQDLSPDERARLQRLLAETGDQMTRNP